VEALHSDMQAGRVCFADGPEARRAYDQLEAPEPEMREENVCQGSMMISAFPATS
jgi:hypothetical protein